MSLWRKRIVKFFRGPVQSELSRMLAAKSCREGWLQGEIFLAMTQAYPRSCFQVNERRSDTPFDISAQDPPMVGEIKVLGSGYQAKVVTGRGLGEFSGRLDQVVTPSDAATAYHWGLMKDYSRLVQHEAQVYTERLLILVVADPDAEPEKTLGRVLKGIRFKGEERSARGDGWLARIWSLDTE